MKGNRIVDVKISQCMSFLGVSEEILTVKLWISPSRLYPFLRECSLQLVCYFVHESFL